MSADPGPLKLAVVGHTNAGKTSLVRTLLRSGEFGEVRDRGGTTRQVVSAPMAVDGRTLIELYDSPGLENAPELIDWLDRLPGDRHDGPERIAQLLDDAQARKHFDHEVRVLTMMLEVDLALYVIDAREPVLEKYQDELAILGRCAKPLIAVLNFTASADSRERQWREALARVTLHTVLSFDAVVRDPATEIQLYEKLKSQLDAFVPVIDQWLSHRQHEEALRRRAALGAVAEMLIDAAALRRQAPQTGHEAVVEQMRNDLRQREQACVETLLDLYRFGREDYEDTGLPLSGGQWQADLFDPDALRFYGIRTGQYIGAGAGTGAVIDLGTGGLSLGAGTAAGAMIGAGLGLVRQFGGQVMGRMRSQVTLSADEATLRLLTWRQLYLLAALIRRGHASQVPLATPDDPRWQGARLPKALKRARHYPHWSTLNRECRQGSRRETAKETLVDELARDLGQFEP